MAGEITITVPTDATLAAVLDLPAAEISLESFVVQGPPGPEGPQGPRGTDADGATDPGDLTLIFDNRLI